MRNVVLYIASSIDGFIASKDGSVDWLYPIPPDNDYGYGEFYASIDTIIMGRKTFDKDMELSNNAFTYRDKVNYAFTRNGDLQHDHVQFVTEDPVAFTKRLKEQEGKDIWLLGGGNINTVLLNAGLIDKMIVSLMPIVVGDGIKLFESDAKLTEYTTADTKVYETGLVQMTMVLK